MKNELKKFYEEDYPEELQTLKEVHFANYLRVKSLLFEVNQELDSATHYCELVATQIMKDPTKFLLATFFFRYGQFMERQNDIDGALVGGASLKAEEFAEICAQCGQSAVS